MGEISDAVNRGSTLSDAIGRTGDYFPALFREMVDVGEETGNLAEVFRHLADHYDQQVALARAFLASIAWPALQLVAAVAIFGLLIFVMAILPTGPGGKPRDVLGLGVTGMSAVVLYFVLVGLAATAVGALVVAMRRGAFWARPLQRLTLQLPVVGGALQTLALSRMAWALHLTMETSMDIRRSMELSLRSTRNARYTDSSDQIITDVTGGLEIHEALSRTGAYPNDFLDTLEVGERSGRLPESMKILSQQYQDKARRALATLTMVAGWAVWAVVAVIIIVAIFRIFQTMYLGPIQDALEW
jgi:type IV pilus assembly protein PilC